MFYNYGHRLKQGKQKATRKTKDIPTIFHPTNDTEAELNQQAWPSESQLRVASSFLPFIVSSRRRLPLSVRSDRGDLAPPLLLPLYPPRPAPDLEAPLPPDLRAASPDLAAGFYNSALRGCDSPSWWFRAGVSRVWSSGFVWIEEAAGRV